MNSIELDRNSTSHLIELNKKMAEQYPICKLKKCWADQTNFAVDCYECPIFESIEIAFLKGKNEALEEYNKQLEKLLENERSERK